MQKAYQKNEHEIYLENEAGERIAEILFPEVLFARTGRIIRISISSTGDGRQPAGAGGCRNADGACSAGDSGAGRNGYGDLFVCSTLAGEARQIKPPLSWEIIRRLIRIGTVDVPVRMILYCIQRSTRPIRLS